MERFIVTSELGKLCRWLRILGYDTLYYKSENVPILTIAALREERTLLTKDNKVPTHRGIRLLKIKSDSITEQIAQVFKALGLKRKKDLMFTRCITCNEELKQIAKRQIKAKVPPFVYKTQKDFTTCPVCKQIYWAGTHWGNAKKYFSEIKIAK